MRRLAAAACCALIAAGGCGGDAAGDRLAPTRGVVLLTLGNVGAGHLGAYGATRPTSPFFDRLATRGALFDWAIAQSPSPLASNVSLHTGLYPQQHGVSAPAKAMPPGLETLAERFSTFGYVTAGFSEGGFIDRHWGFHRGFDSFTDPPATSATAVADTFARGLDFLDRLAPGDRFFLYLHTRGAAAPYEPPAPFAGRFSPSVAPPAFAPTAANLRRADRGFLAADPATAAIFAARYDEGVAYLDGALETFFAGLERLGLAASTTIVVTGDHGEEFLEHGGLGHFQVYPETVRVPLLVVHPEIAGGERIPELVQLIDVAPTLYDLARLPPAATNAGRSLVPLLAGARREASWAYSEVAAGRRQRALFERRDGRIRQLVDTSLAAERDGTWVTRGAALEISPPAALSVVSFHRPRLLDLRLDGEDLGAVPIGAAWTPLRLELPAARPRHRLELRTDGCDSPRALGLSDDPRCLSFKLRGAPVRLVELFALDADPRATADVAADELARRDRLWRRLDELVWSTLETPPNRPPTDDVVETLRALGYD